MNTPVSADILIEKTTYSDHPLSSDVIAMELKQELAQLRPGEHLVLVVKHGGKACGL